MHWLFEKHTFPVPVCVHPGGAASIAQNPSPHDPQAPQLPLLHVGGGPGVAVIVGVGVAIGVGVARAQSGGQAAGAFFTPTNLPG